MSHTHLINVTDEQVQMLEALRTACERAQYDYQLAVTLLAAGRAPSHSTFERVSRDDTLTTGYGAMLVFSSPNGNGA